MRSYFLAVFFLMNLALPSRGEAAERINEGGRLAANGRLFEAAEVFQQALEEDPDSLFAQAGLADVYLQQQRWRAAVDLLEQVGPLPEAPPAFSLADWYVVGPFDNTNDEGFDRVYPPEEEIRKLGNWEIGKLGDRATGKLGNQPQPPEPNFLISQFPSYPGRGDVEVRWQRVRGQERLNLSEWCGEEPYGVAYVLAEFTPPAGGLAELQLGSDDGIKAWLNGELVWENHVHRPLTPGSDRAVVRLKEGANLLLLKVENAEVLWECTARINYQPDLDGLREQAQRGLEAARGTALITLSDAGLGPRYRQFFIFQGGTCLETPEIGRGVRLPPGEYDVRVGFPSGHVGRTVRVAADEEVVVPSALYTFERLRPPESLSDLPQSLYLGDEYLGTFYGSDTVRLYPGEYTVVTGRQETVIDEWEVIGPFPNPDNAGRETVYPPEEEGLAPLSATGRGRGRGEGIDREAKYPGLDGQRVGWQHVAGTVQVPLHEIMPAGYAVAYAYATFESEEDTDRAILQVGSDDGVRAWLNGEVVWTNHAIRPLSVDHVRVRLKKGRNTLLLKIDNSPYQGEFGRWECSAAVTLLEGKTIRLVAE